MLATLHKRSIPSWTKEFATEADACAELLTHICGKCLAGEMSMVNAPTEHFPAPLRDSIDDLLGTPCGCEFEYEIAKGEDRRTSHVYPGADRAASLPHGGPRLSSLAPAEGQAAGTSSNITK